MENISGNQICSFRLFMLNSRKISAFLPLIYNALR
jgi:hypothetical protein